MQIKNNRPNNLQKSWIIGLVKLGLLLGCSYFIYIKLEERSISLDDVMLPAGFSNVLITVLLLMVVNWFLEALRWKVSIEQFEPIMLKSAWSTVLIGLALNWVLPFTTGDLIARIANQRDKHQSTAAAVLNRGIMLSLTLIMGVYGMSYMVKAYDWNGWWLLGGLLGGILILIVFRKAIDRFLAYFRKLSRKRLLVLVTISLLRYSVFVFQFYLLLSVFLPSIEPNTLIAGIGWIFLVRSSLPLFLGGVGVREASGLLFFEAYTTNLALVIAPIFLIWVVNTVIPSFVGLVLMLNYKRRSSS